MFGTYGTFFTIVNPGIQKQQYPGTRIPRNFRFFKKNRKKEVNPWEIPSKFPSLEFFVLFFSFNEHSKTNLSNGASPNGFVVANSWTRHVCLSSEEEMTAPDPLYFTPVSF